MIKRKSSFADISFRRERMRDLTSRCTAVQPNNRTADLKSAGWERPDMHYKSLKSMVGDEVTAKIDGETYQGILTQAGRGQWFVGSTLFTRLDVEAVKDNRTKGRYGKREKKS